MAALGSFPPYPALREAWEAMPQGRPRATGPAAGSQGQRPAEKPSGVAHALWLHGHTCPASRRGPGQAGSAGAPNSRLRSRPITAPHAAHHTPSKDRMRSQAGLGLSHLQTASAELADRTAELTKRQTHGWMRERTDPPPTKEHQPPQSNSPAATARKCVSADARKLQLPGGFALRSRWTPFPRGRQDPELF